MEPAADKLLVSRSFLSHQGAKILPVADFRSPLWYSVFAYSVTLCPWRRPLDLSNCSAYSYIQMCVPEDMHEQWLFDRPERGSWMRMHILEALTCWLA